MDIFLFVDGLLGLLVRMVVIAAVVIAALLTPLVTVHTHSLTGVKSLLDGTCPLVYTYTKLCCTTKNYCSAGTNLCSCTLADLLMFSKGRLCAV